jgi:C4-type Zn-finger protein
MMYFFPFCSTNCYNILCPAFFFYNVLNKHTLTTQRCVSYRKDEMPLIVQPYAEERMIVLQITTHAKLMSLILKSKAGT